ncbi:MAG TPA: peptidoglycan-binding domain-containing protein, partial [Clostridia bacterium]|nr:peptidoglycan-binding domain-containing protein [Clostridia bacterium]
MKRLLALLLALAWLFAGPPALSAAGGASLAVGSKGQEVTALQHKLIEAGFLNGQADGKYGEATRQAVLALQRALKDKGHQLAVDGVAGPATLGLLADEEAMRPFVDFSLGASGPRVINLQNRLIDLKFLDGTADGVFGNQTL